jgi:integrase
MKKHLTGKIVELIKNKKYKIIINMGWDEATKSYPRKSRTFYGTKQEAEEFYWQFKHLLENPAEIQSQETTGGWLDFWLENDAKLLQSWERNTERRVRGIVGNNLKPHIGSIPLVDLTPNDILDMYTKLGKKGGGRYGKPLSKRSIRYVHTVLNQCLNQAVVRGRINTNPAAGLAPASEKGKSKDKWVVLDEGQLSEFLQQIKDHRDYPLIFVAAYTGLRQSEILGLALDRILWEEKAIVINQTLHKNREDGEEEFEHRGRTKNPSSTRTIDVSERVLEVIKDYLITKGRDIESKQLVFTEDDGSPIDSDNLSSRYRKLTKKHGHEGMTFHHLRHTHATILLSNGAYINEVAERLGHTDPRITLSTYGHVLPKNRRRLADRFDELVSE